MRTSRLPSTRSARSIQRLGQPAERYGLAVLVAALPEERECLPEIADGLLVCALAQAYAAEVAERAGHAGGLPGGAVDGQGLLKQAGGLGADIYVGCWSP